MDKDMWKIRLQEAITASAKSKRAISIASGNGPGYVHSILAEGKDPTITNLIAVCKAIPISLTYILHGHEVSPDDEELLRQLYEHPSKRAAIRALLETEKPNETERQVETELPKPVDYEY